MVSERCGVSPTRPCARKPRASLTFLGNTLSWLASPKRAIFFVIILLMNPWASHRKTIIFLIVFAVLLIIIAIPTYFSFQNKPSCFNTKQDGDETGIDCGGGCALLCTPEILPLIARGDARLLRIASSTYEVVILIENPNILGTVARAPYSFNIYSGVSKSPIKTIIGNTNIARNSTFALFAGPFTLNEAGSLRATFNWGKDLVWEKSNTVNPLLSVENINLVIASTSAPRLEAKLLNRSLNEVNNVEVIVLLSDHEGNIVGAGKTFVDNLPPSVTAPLVFSWPQAFDKEVVSIRILPHILPDKSFLR